MTFSILIKYFHPEIVINAHFENFMPRDCAKDLTAVCISIVMQKSHTYKAVFFTISWMTTPIYSSMHYATVVSEGLPNLLFDKIVSKLASPLSSQGTSANGEDKVALLEAVLHPMGKQAKDIAVMRNQGFKVDDDNEPALKKYPQR